MTRNRLGIFAVAVALAGSAYPCTIDHRLEPRAVNKAMAASKAAAPPWVGPAHSGSWFSPQRSGEGFTLQILDNGSALAVWFTYPPAGSAAGQAWIMAQDGVIEGDRIRFTTTFTTRGPRFGAQYDRSLLQIIPWGTIEFRFLDCNRGEVSYSGPAGWGAGVHEIVRLTALSELECDGKKRLRDSGARALTGLKQRSGAWYDPSHNGEGWKVEELPDGRAQVYWFTYDERGEQAWMVGVAPGFGDRIEVSGALQPVGARFGENFDPASVRRSPWGNFTLAFESCDRAGVQYESPLPAFGSGALAPVRLTRLAGASCVEGNPAVPAQGSWRQGQRQPITLSESAVATAGGKSCVAGGFDRARTFLCYEVAKDAWTILPDMPAGRDHAAAIAVGGDVFVTGGYRTDNAPGQEISGWRYRAATGAWEPAPQLPDVAANAAAVLNGSAYFGQRSGDIHQVDLKTLVSRRIPGDGRAGRDHAQLLAFQGELWMIGGRDTRLVDHGRVSIFDPASETWRPGPFLNSSRAGFAAAASSTAIFVAGGERIGTPSWSVIDSFEAIAAGENQWTRLAATPVRMHGVNGAVHGNAFYMLGGSSAPGGVANHGTVQIYSWDP